MISIKTLKREAVRPSVYLSVYLSVWSFCPSSKCHTITQHHFNQFAWYAGEVFISFDVSPLSIFKICWLYVSELYSIIHKRKGILKTFIGLYLLKWEPFDIYSFRIDVSALLWVCIHLKCVILKFSDNHSRVLWAVFVNFGYWFISIKITSFCFILVFYL